MQQARAVIICGSLLVIVVRIRREGLRQLEWRNFKNGVDKMAGFCGKRVDDRQRRAAQNCRKKALAFASDCCRIGVVRRPLLQSFSFKKARLPAGFLFLGHSDFLERVKTRRTMPKPAMALNESA